MILGIDLGGTNIRIGQLKDDKLINKISAPSPSKMNLDDSLVYMKAQIQKQLTPDVKGIGIGVPSVVDVQKGIVYNVANIPAWVEVPLKELLEDAFHLPVFVNNDANCFVLGEHRFGTGQSFRNILGITLGTGVGGGIIINNELYEGVNVGAGEIGCMRYLDATYEDYAGSMFFTNHYGITGKEAAQRANNKDPEALKIWDAYALHLGELVQAVLFAYDPELIVFGGGLSEAYPLYEQRMKEALHAFPYPKTIEKLQIKLSTNPDIAILGAAALVK